MAATLPQYAGPAAWRAEDMRLRTDWMYSLKQTEAAELLEALAYCENRAHR